MAHVRYFLSVWAGLAIAAGHVLAVETPEARTPISLSEVLAGTSGLCVLVDVPIEVVTQVAARPGLLVHCLSRDADVTVRLQKLVTGAGTQATLLAEHWTATRLPHADNLANTIIVGNLSEVSPDEISRVLCPRGIAVRISEGSVSQSRKPVPADTDEWTHQWHAADGGLATDDKRVGVPQGVQWLAGPLFAMAGRKSSTQSLVSAGGINFYLTQNVLDNVGASEKRQYLVARDAYNGLTRWQRPWTGPYVTGDGETNARMVATPDRLFVAGDNQLLALNSQTGAVLASQSLAAPADKLLFHDESVLVQSALGLQAFDSEFHQERWSAMERNTSGLVAWDGSAFYLIRGRSPDGNFQHELVRREVRTGKQQWRRSTQPHVLSSMVQVGFVQDGLIGLQAHGHLHLFSANDGQHLWSRTTEARPGKDYSDERYVGHFYRRGLVWMLDHNSPRKPDGQNVWLGLKPATGAVVSELTTQGEWPRTDTPAKMGCQLLIASDQYIMIPRQATYIDFETGQKLPFKFVRGGCGLGFVPANGLVYSHPHACGCFSEAIRGFIGMHSTAYNDKHPEESAEARLQTFSPLQWSDDSATSPSDWHHYRRDPHRSAASAVVLPAGMDLRWSTKVASRKVTVSQLDWELRSGNPVTAPTVSGSMVYVADVDGGRVFAVDLQRGAVRWTFQANGRIDSPPTIYRGLCLFGAHDGYVYGLDAASGRLGWKFRAAPVERRIVAFGQVESTWPVAGSVLVHEGIAFAAAGRAPDADGGITVHALNPLTGESFWSARVESETFRGLCDYLIAGDGVVYLGNWQFDARTGANGPAPRRSPHLQGGKVGLLEASWTRHDLALRKEIQTWTAAGVEGQLLAFSPKTTVAYQAEKRVVEVTGPPSQVYTVPSPEQVTAMALAGRSLVLAGGKDRARPLGAGFLRVVDSQTGQITIEHKLSTEAVFDGIAITQEHILVATQDGQLHAFGAGAPEDTGS